MDVNFSQSDCCGEGAIKATDNQKSAAMYDGPDPEIVGQFMDPKKSEMFQGNTKFLTNPRKRRTTSGRTLRGGKDQ
jgi:hypothetical protein